MHSNCPPLDEMHWKKSRDLEAGGWRVGTDEIQIHIMVCSFSLEPWKAGDLQMPVLCLIMTRPVAIAIAIAIAIEGYGWIWTWKWNMESGQRTEARLAPPEDA